MYRLCFRRIVQNIAEEKLPKTFINALCFCNPTALSVSMASSDCENVPADQDQWGAIKRFALLNSCRDVTCEDVILM